MLLDADDSQLVLVDYQLRLMPAIFENQQVIANAVRLARMAQAFEVPVWATEQLPEKLGRTVPDLLAAVEAAGGKTMSKAHFSAVPDGLGDWLRPSTCKSQNQKRARAPSSLLAAKPTCACCKQRWICSNKSLKSGSSPTPAARAANAIVTPLLTDWRAMAQNW